MNRKNGQAILFNSGQTDAIKPSTNPVEKRSR